jgi:DNA-3-methyladenine glycosylase II
MIHKFDPSNFKRICNKLAKQDDRLAGIIKAHGHPPMWSRPNTFETLVHIILEQQVSLASALSALNQLRKKVKRVTPANVLALTDAELKACYFSRQKTIYVRGLATALINKQLNLRALEILPDEEIRTQLTTLKGIGNWTVDVYLMFVLQRADVFPIGDLAAVNALKRLKDLPKETSREKLLAIAADWQPHRTVATMLLWHFYLSSRGKK